MINSEGRSNASSLPDGTHFVGHFYFSNLAAVFMKDGEAAHALLVDSLRWSIPHPATDVYVVSTIHCPALIGVN